ncbi:hypothetical protein [Paraglaciecola sp. L1A13]|uniref:hypothetical protein n=1 Tax=Paraglaciecola sp. L1A13 TaxID=2686359 RepID=UPI00131C568C|nr:hypothetical protein [Paraglaciecola sp. L1A13]
MVKFIERGVASHIFALATLFCLILSSPLFARNCNISVNIKSIEGELGYQSRGQFCEGLYESKISADFELVSLLYSPFPTFSVNDVLNVFVPKLSSELFPSGASITALSLKPRMYYRMDATMADNSSLTWPLNQVISKIPLTHAEIGMFGWTNRNTDILYTPLSIQLEREKLFSIKPETVQVAVRAGVNIEYLVWRVFSQNIYGEEHLIEEFHAAGHPIRFNFELLEFTNGIYQIQLDAKSVGSDEWLTQILSVAAPTE